MEQLSPYLIPGLSINSESPLKPLINLKKKQVAVVFHNDLWSSVMMTILKCDLF